MGRTILQFEARRDGSALRSLSGRGERLLEALRAGADPEEVFRELHRCYYHQVYKRFEWRGYPAEDCRDLTQETFLRLVRGGLTFRGQARFETWLMEIANNVWRSELRSRSTQKRDGREVSPEDLVEENPHGEIESVVPACSTAEDPLENLLMEERGILLREAVGQLPPRMRRCVLLLLDQDLKYREIAVLEQIDVNTVKSHLGEARKRIRQYLDAYFDEAAVRVSQEVHHEARHRES